MRRSVVGAGWVGSSRAVVWFGLVLAVGCARDSMPVPSGAAEAEIRTLLSAQTEAWNRADVEGFMLGYWRDPSLRFVSGGAVRQGWDETLARYRERYPGAEAMGQLAFEDVAVRLLSDDWAMAFGRYRLRRVSDEPTGLFTLIFQRRPEGWRIVHDHTSADS